MRLPLSWLGEFIQFPKKTTVDEIVEAFIKVGFEVEGVENPASSIAGPVVIGKVQSIEELTGLKKPIRYVGLDCGEGATRYVICGATNFAAGDHVVVALPGAVLPGGFAISARETYGRTSNGMICSARELGMSDEHNGILVVNEPKPKIGGNALNYLQLDDPVIDIAVNPDRGYAMSIRGAARELAMSLDLEFNDIHGKQITSYLEKKKKRGKITKALIADKTGADRIYLRSLTNVDSTAPTPAWMAKRLSQCGMRSISLAVDITNYVMLELGQPLHAFDAEKIQGTLRVQRAGKFTTLTTLDNQKRKLSKEDLVIADDKKPLALAGTMGGLDSEVTSSTTTIALEAVHFDSVSIARNARRHILSTEASRRFERGVDPELAEIASARAAQLLVELAGASYVGTSASKAPRKPELFSFDPQGVSQLIGAKYTNSEVERALLAIGCKIAKKGKKWTLTSPSWRSDLRHLSDIAEEVARYYGYARIPSILPVVKPLNSGKIGLSTIQSRKRALSVSLAHHGFTEVHNYPFVSSAQMELFGFTGDRAKTFEIANPISTETPYLRTHLTPGLLEAAARNLSRGENAVALFESGLVFRNTKTLTPAVGIPTSQRPTANQMKKIYESVPHQALHIAGVLAGEVETSGWWGKGRSADWSDAVATVRNLLSELNQSFEVTAVELAPWHPGRCAEFQINGKAIAHAGEIHPRVIAALGLPARTSAFALIVDAITETPPVLATPVITMPAAIQDISMFVEDTVSAGEVERTLKEGAGELLESIRLFDRYQKPGESQVSLAFTLTFRAADRTLTSEEVTAMRERAGKLAADRHKAVIRK